MSFGYTLFSTKNKANRGFFAQLHPVHQWRGIFSAIWDGLKSKLEHDTPRTFTLLQQHPQIEALIIRLRRILHELWLGEFGWKSIEVLCTHL